MAAVGRGSAPVADRARRRRYLVRETGRVLEWGPHETGNRARRSVHGSQLAVDAERKRDDGDHHRVARSHLEEGLTAGLLRYAHSENELVSGERVALDAEKELLQRYRALAADARDLNLGPRHEQRRQPAALRR